MAFDGGLRLLVTVVALYFGEEGAQRGIGGQANEDAQRRLYGLSVCLTTCQGFSVLEDFNFDKETTVGDVSGWTRVHCILP